MWNLFYSIKRNYLNTFNFYNIEIPPVDDVLYNLSHSTFNS